jgi:eukaryotic-like serine/threonine-protein kinase
MPGEVTRDQSAARQRFAAAQPDHGIERDRVFASLHERMFGSSDPVSVGRFVVLAKIGVGAMGTVFAAYDPQLDRKVALKVLGAAADTDAGERRDREARSLARLRHPNVVAVHEVGSHRGERFIAMDLVDGVTLRAWLQSPCSWRQVLDVLGEAGSALVAAHTAGIVHRDFKPDNVLVEHGHARVVDFGLSRGTAAEPTSDPQRDGVAMQDTVDVVGTPAYMAPEAFTGEANEATDQYSFCATLYEALYGVRPFAGVTAVTLRADALAMRLQRPTLRRRVPSWLRRAVLRGLAAEPTLRWPSIAALLQTLARRRRRPIALAIGAAALAGTIAGALVVSASSRPEQRCAPKATRLDELWNERTRSAIAAAFDATDLAYAADSWERAREIIARYVDDWTRQHHEACVATYEQGVQSEAMFDARMQCLDRRLDELAALTSALAEPDATTVTRAVAASSGLSAVVPCADVVELGRELARARPGVAASPELFERLARAQIGRRTGHYAAALPDARALAATADAEGFTELAGAAHLACASLEDRAGELEAAAASARTAVARADVAGDDGLRAEAEVLLVSLQAQRRQFEAAFEWVGLSRATLTRLGDPPTLRTTLVAHEGTALHLAGRFPEALARRREVLELREEQLDELDPALADAHANVAITLLDLGELAEAHEHLALALELRTRSLGALHPDIARTHNDLGNVLTNQGDMEAAARELQLAIDIGTIALGPDDISVGRSFVNLGNTLAQGRDPAASVPAYERGVAIIERARGPADADLGAALGNFGRLLAHLEASDPQRAIEVLTRARAIEVAALGPDHADLCYIDNSLATAYRRAGRLDDAALAAESAVRIATLAFGESHGMVAQAWGAVGEVAAARHDLRGATAAFERALAIVEAEDSLPAARAKLRFHLAEVLADSGELARAVVLAQAAHGEFLSDGDHYPEDLRSIEQWLAAHQGASG